jgi:hypothetical protein
MDIIMDADVFDKQCFSDSLKLFQCNGGRPDGDAHIFALRAGCAAHNAIPAYFPATKKKSCRAGSEP